VLTKTPYLLEGSRAEAVMRDVDDLVKEVDVLRQGGALDEQTLRRLRGEWKIEQVYETTGIEGNQLDLMETRLAITRGITIGGKPPKDSREAQNMNRTLDFLEELSHGDRPLLASELREIQSHVLGEEEGAGRFRKSEVKISGSSHLPPPAGSVDADIKAAFDWLAETVDCPAPLASAVMHAWIAHIHPFTDGNGRTARAIMNLILIRAGYPIVLIRRKDRNRYYDALAASDEGDIAPLVELITQRSRDSLRHIKRVRAAASGLTDEIIRLEQRLREQYETWQSAMALLLRSLEEAAGKVRDDSDGHIVIAIREYSQVTPEDYLAMLRKDPSGNGWLAALRGQGFTHVSEMLLWIGFASDGMRENLGRHAGASVFFSEKDPAGAHPFRELAVSSSFVLREIGFDGGHFWVRDRAGDIHQQPVDLIATQILQDFIKYYLS
jgi:Fic family protein